MSGLWHLGWGTKRRKVCWVPSALGWGVANTTLTPRYPRPPFPCLGCGGSLLSRADRRAVGKSQAPAKLRLKRQPATLMTSTAKPA